MSRPPEEALVRLAAGWAGHWPTADAVALAGDVSARLGAALTRWALADPRPLPGGVVALVCAVTRADGAPAVLKLQPRGHGEDGLLRAEGRALAHWASTGVVPAVLATADGGMTLLLERVLPGTTLDASGLPEDDRLEILGGLVRRLHAAGPPRDAAIPHVQEHAPAWGAHRPPAPDDVLLHADLHGANVLRAADGWRVIDPHAAVGDRHADAWALIDPLAPPLPDDEDAAADEARRRTERYARAAALDPGRVAGWTVARARAEASELATAPDPADRAWGGRLARFADALDRTGSRRIWDRLPMDGRLPGG